MSTDQKVGSIFLLLAVCSLSMFVFVAALPVFLVFLIVTLCLWPENGTPEDDPKYRKFQTARQSMRISGIIALAALGTLVLMTVLLGILC